MWMRMHESIAFTRHDVLPAVIDLGTTSSGVSMLYIWSASGLSLVTGILWILMWKFIRWDIMLVENENQPALLYDYNICCSTYN